MSTRCPHQHSVIHPKPPKLSLTIVIGVTITIIITSTTSSQVPRCESRKADKLRSHKLAYWQADKLTKRTGFRPNMGLNNHHLLRRPNPYPYLWIWESLRDSHLILYSHNLPTEDGLQIHQKLMMWVYARRELGRYDECESWILCIFNANIFYWPMQICPISMHIFPFKIVASLLLSPLYIWY